MTMPDQENHTGTSAFRPLAGLCAWLWPGSGHIMLGDRKRGFLIMFGVLFLVLGGLLIGGVDSVDRRHDRLWFVAQAMCGPIAFGIDQVREGLDTVSDRDWSRDLALRSRLEDGDPELIKDLRLPAIGHVNEMGTLYIALAGLMNLAVILDAAFYRARPSLERRRASTEGTA